MTKIFITDNTGKEHAINAEDGLSLLEVAHKNNIDLEGACEGSLACSTCHVVIAEDDFDRIAPAEEEEEDMLDLAFGLTPTSRLACQIIISEELDGMRVAMPSGVRNMTAGR